MVHTYINTHLENFIYGSYICIACKYVNTRTKPRSKCQQFKVTIWLVAYTSSHGRDFFLFFVIFFCLELFLSAIVFLRIYRSKFFSFNLVPKSQKL